MSSKRIRRNWGCPLRRCSRPWSRCRVSTAESMEELEVETCELRGLGTEDELTLEQLLDLDGVGENECLSKRREQIIGFSQGGFDDSIVLKLCNGAYDYQCPEWEHEQAETIRSKLAEQHLIGISDLSVAEDVLGPMAKGGEGEVASVVALLASVAAVLVCGVMVLAARSCKKSKKLDMEDIVDEDAAAYGTF